ncbi:hypothetical protein E1B28_011779 [Marasmius oreades]|uniref:Uncharacterized protein n=1 Tax=Marasmius oreades TaxID=181124 RepID=A0A9P7RVG2_9AGAR|nr:uncharacterized protein E1B28_011779 [Marasmius oreades]KAG7090172.1 hypothetical protein E1B28_011779 [Marasmius oreades]
MQDEDEMVSSSPSAVYAEKIDHARGRCCLIAGTALAEEFEEALESAEMGVLDSEDVIDKLRIWNQGRRNVAARTRESGHVEVRKRIDRDVHHGCSPYLYCRPCKAVGNQEVLASIQLFLPDS